MTSMRPRSWTKVFRAPDAESVRLFGPRVRALFDHAVSHGLRAFLLTFTSRCFGSPAEVLDHVKVRWGSFQQKGVWRRVVAALWVFGDHEHPHVHVLVVLPPDMNVRDLLKHWGAGFTHSRAAYGDAARLADYFAAQRRISTTTPAQRRRFHGYRAPRPDHVLCIHTPSPSDLSGGHLPRTRGRRRPGPSTQQLRPAPQGENRDDVAGTGGHTVLGLATCVVERPPANERSRICGSERESVSVRGEAATELGAGTKKGCPPGGSDVVSALASSLAPPTTTSPTKTSSRTRSRRKGHA